MLNRICIALLYCLLGITEGKGQDKIYELEKLGETIYEGVYTGNGLLGTMTYLSPEGNVRIDLGRTDVYDHRTEHASALYDRARLPIGHLELKPHSSIQKATGSMDYENAEASAYIETKEGALHIKTLTLAEENIILIEMDGKSLSALKWMPEVAESPRLHFAHAKKQEHYPQNPQGYFQNTEDMQVYVQPLLAGGGYAVAFKKYTEGDKVRYIATVTYGKKDMAFVEEAKGLIEGFDTTQIGTKVQEHRKWWSAYNQLSSLNLPDERMQKFYDMQVYKLASATRKDKPAIDLQGPWTCSTPWPAYWHNLNIQLTYSPTFAANRLEIAESLINMIDRNRVNLIQNVPPAYRYNSAGIGRSSGPDMVSPVYLEKGKDLSALSDEQSEMGNLTWMLHSYYQYYRATMDPLVYDRLLDLLQRSVNYYIHLLEEDNNGRYHIAVKTYSPEYSKGLAYDTNYDLSILKWGLSTLIAMDNEKGGKHPDHAKWRNILNNLRSYPQGENGFLIAKDVPYAESHRHYSHLMMIYPFYEVNWDQTENRELIQKSIAHWQSMKTYLQGYSFSGMASMYAMMGKGDDALSALETLLTKYIKPNTLYAETGPVIETPLSAMASLQELCLQHWGGVTRIFPAVPTDWEDLSFNNFRTDGSFLVSARREDGKTTWIEIKSQHGGAIKIKTDMKEPVVWIDGEEMAVAQEEGVIEMLLKTGSRAVISPKAADEILKSKEKWIKLK